MNKGILFSGSRKNAELAREHIKNHGILYWCLPKGVNYSKYYFPIIGLLHVKKEGIRYKCTINDIMPFSTYHFDDSKKKPSSWIHEQKVEKKSYKSTLVITKITPFQYDTFSLKNWKGEPIRNAPQGGYSKIIIPDY